MMRSMLTGMFVVLCTMTAIARGDSTVTDAEATHEPGTYDYLTCTEVGYSDDILADICDLKHYCALEDKNKLTSNPFCARSSLDEVINAVIREIKAFDWTNTDPDLAVPLFELPDECYSSPDAETAADCLFLLFRSSD